MKVSRKSLIIILGAVVSVIAGSAVWLAGGRQPSAPDFREKKPEQISEYLRSQEFRDLDRDARRAIGREAMSQMMVSRAKEYSELAPEQRIAYLDKVIDTMQERRREFESMRREIAAGRGGPGSRRGGLEGRGRDSESGRSQLRPGRQPMLSRSGAPDNRWRTRRRGRRRTPERMRARSEFVDPRTRAQMAKFRQALRERMRERGIQFRPRPR